MTDSKSIKEEILENIRLQIIILMYLLLVLAFT